MLHLHEEPRAVHCHGAFQVLAQRQEVMFRDGSTVQLHPVLRAGIAETFLRAVRQSCRWVVIDLRYHSAEIEADILRLQPRDTPGVVFYTLRQAYPSARAFCDRIALSHLHAWWQDEDTAPAPALAAAA